MKRRVFIVCCLILNFLYAYTQAPYTIRGIVKDSSGSLISKATVLVLSAADSIQVLSGSDGKFIISGLRDPAFNIRVTTSGYKTYYESFSIPVGDKEYSLAPIVLQVEYEE